MYLSKQQLLRLKVTTLKDIQSFIYLGSWYLIKINEEEEVYVQNNNCINM